MYHFETSDLKTKKPITFEDTDFKTILKTVLNHNNGKFNDNEESDVIIEDSVGNILQTVSEKYLKDILGIHSVRKTAKLEKSKDTFNKLIIKDIATVTFKNKCHDGIITIWENDYDSVPDTDSDDELEDALLAEDDIESDLESVHMQTNTNILEENKKLQKENKKLKEQITILKSFVSKYRDLAIEINSDTNQFSKLI
jgi:hypothetical protein